MRIIFALLFCILSSFTQAETINATLSTTNFKWVNTSWCSYFGQPCSTSNGLPWATVNKAVADKMAQQQTATCTTYYPEPSTSTANNGCTCLRYDNVTMQCATGGAVRGGAFYECPANQDWTLSGTTCTRPDCSAGQTRNASTGVCEAQCGNSGATWNGLNCACPGIQLFNATDKTCYCETGGRLKGTSIGGTGSTSPSTTCYSGCVASVGGLSIAAGGSWVAELGNFSGAKCSGGTGTTPQEIKVKEPTVDTRTEAQKCLAAGQGYVTTSTGTTCTSSGNSPTPITTTQQETKTIKDQNGAVTGTQETKVECVGTQCTTTITTKDGTGTVTGTTTTFGTGSGSDNGTGNGNGETDCDKHPNSLGCMDAGSPGGDDAVGSSPIGPNSITPVALGGGGTCPSPITLPRGQTFSWQPICDFAFGIRPIVLILAWLAAGYIVLGWGTKDNG